MKCDLQKAKRVNWFVLEHAEANDGYDEDPKTAIVDFVTDLRHLAAQDGVDFDDVVRLATIHYACEIIGFHPDAPASSAPSRHAG